MEALETRIIYVLSGHRKVQEGKQSLVNFANIIVQKIENFSFLLLRYKFLSYKQKECQSFDEFMTQLKELSRGCETV